MEKITIQQQKKIISEKTNEESIQIYVESIKGDYGETAYKEIEKFAKSCIRTMQPPKKKRPKKKNDGQETFLLN